MERPAAQAGSGGLEPARHRGLQRDDFVRTLDHAEPQGSWRTPRWKGTGAPERQLERRLSDVQVHALNDRRTDRVGRAAGKRQRQVHVFRANNLQVASAIAQRGDDRRLFGSDRGTRVVR